VTPVSVVYQLEEQPVLSKKVSKGDFQGGYDWVYTFEPMKIS
jgi:hypothetical protein